MSINTTGQITTKGRPLRLAFVIPPNDNSSLKAAIEINSVLWGGVFNPIIPLYKRKTKRWRQDLSPRSSKEIHLGYIKAFDPDVIVSVNCHIPEYMKNLEGVDFTNSHEVIEYHEGEIITNYGISLLATLEHIYNEHFRFLEKDPISVSFPKIPKQNSAFWASWFGSVPSRYLDFIQNTGYSEGLEIDYPEIDDVKDILSNRILFPRRITAYGLAQWRRGSSHDHVNLYYMDADDFLDVIDFWNLRALGRSVLPIPIQLTEKEDFNSFVKGFVANSRLYHRANKDIVYYPTFIRGSSRSMDQMTQYAQSLKDEQEDTNQTYTLQHWYPRIWDDWARAKDSADPNDVYFEDDSLVKINDLENRVTLQTTIPSFTDNYMTTHNPWYANEIEPRFYGSHEYAEVFPRDYGKRTKSIISDIGPNKWRIGRNGLVHLVSGAEEVNWSVPKSADLFKAWMNDKDWKIQISTSGLIAEQLVKQFEGSIAMFADPSFLKFVELMSGAKVDSSREKSVGEVKSRLHQIYNSDSAYERLLELGVFKIGLQIQCPSCQRKSWFEIEDVTNNLSCPLCLQDFKAVPALTNQAMWFYKTTGPLSIPGYVDGAFCTVLTVDYLGRSVGGARLSPIYSFNAKEKRLDMN